MGRHRFRFLLGIATAVLVVLGVGSAWGKTRIAVLGVEPIDSGDAASQKQTAATAAWLTDALRQRVALARPTYETPGGTVKDLAEVKILADCLDASPDCMAPVGGDMGLDRMIYGTLTRTSSGYDVSMVLLEVATAAIVRRENDSLPDATGVADVRRKGAALFADLTGVTLHGSLSVKTNVQAGTVYIGGVPKARIANGKATVHNLPEGPVDVSVESHGFEVWDGQADVVAGETQRLSVSLERDTKGVVGSGADSPSPTEPTGGGYRTLAWASAVLTAGGIAAFSITGLKVRQLEGDKDAAIRESWAVADDDDILSDDACAEAKLKNQKVYEICQDGARMANVTNVLIGVSAAMLATTVYFTYKGYVSDERISDRGNQVTVVPEIYPSGAGVGAVIRF